MLETTEKQEDKEKENYIPSTVAGYQFLGTTHERIFFIIVLTFLSAAPIIFGKGIPSHADWHIHMEHAYSLKNAFGKGSFCQDGLITK